jgi:hypothetical protein
MEKKTKSIVVWATVTALTILLYAAINLPVYPRRALPIIWAFFSWNIVAYGFDRGMWPVAFVELDGGGKGNPLAREVMFWATAIVYTLLLVTLAWAD